MKARDMMSDEVLTVPPDMPVTAVAAALRAADVSAAPVVAADGTPLGMISESDLLRRPELRAALRQGGVATPVASTTELQAVDVMTAGLVAVGEDAELADVAALLVAQGIKRVPVMNRGRIVGIVSRADIVEAIANLAPARSSAVRPDHELLAELQESLAEQTWFPSARISTAVRDGVVELGGLVTDAAHRDALAQIAARIAGVRAVHNYVGCITLDRPSSASA